jgi:DNA processing protein
VKHSLETFTKLRLLLEVDGIGSGKLFNLLSKFNSLDSLLGADFFSLISVEGISKNVANRIIKKIDSYTDYSKIIEIELEKLERINACWMTFWSDNYPQNLKNIFAPPIILYYKGTIASSDQNSIAIVGTRMASRYGKSMAEKFSKDLSANKIAVVSGMARGIDSVAHRAALNGGGRTIAVVGSGLDVIYPAENKQLFEDITQSGAVITEYKLGTKPDAQNFPKRNRLISGLSLGTLVVESKVSGGAMQTAAFALEQNKEVFAIPGNLGITQSEGTNLLIQKCEAKLVKNCDDILVELNLKIQPKVGGNIPSPTFDLNMFEQKIYDILSNEAKHIDLIATESGINSSECLVHLLSLEFRDVVKQLPGKTFLKI